MDDFDNQLDDWFGGIGETRTVLSGTWRTYLNNACANTPETDHKAIVNAIQMLMDDPDTAVVSVDELQDIVNNFRWYCVSAWEDGEFVHYTMRSPSGWESVALMEKRKISQTQAVRALASIQWQEANPPLVVGSAEIEYAPNNVVQYELWMECWQACEGDSVLANARYDELGGEWRDDSDD